MKTESFQCFNEVIVEPNGYSGPGLVLDEMKSLSETIGLPVRAKFEYRELLITSKTDIDHTLYCFHHKIDTDSVKYCKSK